MKKVECFPDFSSMELLACLLPSKVQEHWLAMLDYVAKPSITAIHQ